MDFVGPLTRSKRGNATILVVVDAFSKFIFFPVRRITSQVVIECLERAYFPTYGVPTSLVTDNATVFRSKLITDLCFRWGGESYLHHTLLHAGFIGRAGEQESQSGIENIPSQIPERLG